MQLPIIWLSLEVSNAVGVRTLIRIQSINNNDLAACLLLFIILNFKILRSIFRQQRQVFTRIPILVNQLLEAQGVRNYIGKFFIKFVNCLHDLSWKDCVNDDFVILGQFF
jgi:hypothetical protein